MKQVISKHAKKFDIRLFWQYRELLYMLVYRELKIKYAETFIGILWSILNPLGFLVIFSIVFGVFLKIDTAEIPYPVFFLSGMAAWGYFARVVQEASGAFLEFFDVIEKVYFPRIFIPISKVIVQLIDYAVAFLVLFVLMLIYDIPFIFNLIYLPFVVLFTILIASAAAIWISALVARYRDLQQIVSFVLQIGFYFTPVLYPIKVIPEFLQAFYWLNPMAIIVSLHRWCIWGDAVPILQLSIVMLAAVFMLITGIFYAHKVEAIMADIL